MAESAQREMTLREWVERLPASHLARREYDALTAKAVRMNQAAGGEAVAWEVRVMYGPHGPDAGKWSKWQGCDKATHDAVQRGEGFCEYETAEARALVVIGTTPPAAQVQPVSQRVRDMLEERRNRLMNSFGGTPYEDGRVQQQIDEIDAQLAAGEAAQVQQEAVSLIDALDPSNLCHATGTPQWPLNCECPKHATHPAADALARATNGMVAAMRELTLRYQKHFDQAQFPPEFWAELEAAIAQQPEADTSGWSLLDRVEFALRGAGFDYDEAFRIAQLASKPAADALGAVRELPAKTLLVSACLAGRHSFTADAIEDGGEPAIPFEVAVSALDAALAQAPAVRVTDEMVDRAMEAAADACQRHIVCNEAIRAALESAFGQGKANG